MVAYSYAVGAAWRIRLKNCCESSVWKSWSYPPIKTEHWTGSVLFSVPAGWKIAQFATFVRPQGWRKVANWRYFQSLPTLSHQMESPNDIFMQTKLSLTLTITLTLNLLNLIFCAHCSHPQ